MNFKAIFIVFAVLIAFALGGCNKHKESIPSPMLVNAPEMEISNERTEWQS